MPHYADMKPNIEHIKLWIEDLRTTNTRQGQGVLHRVDTNGDRFCCLGRACEVAIANGVEVDIDASEPARGIDYNGYAGVMPPKVAAWYGLESDPHIGYEGLEPATTSLNDVYMLSFAQIADILEARYVK